MFGLGPHFYFSFCDLKQEKLSLEYKESQFFVSTFFVHTD